MAHRNTPNKDPEDEDTTTRTEDACTHLTLMRHTMITGNRGSRGEQIPKATMRKMREILEVNPPPYHNGNEEYTNDTTINMPAGMKDQAFKQGCTEITQYYLEYIPCQYKDITHGLREGDFRTLEWRIHHTQKPNTAPLIEPSLHWTYNSALKYG